jgi:Lon protease-like protein
VLATVGTRRIRVREWLPDDPFPRADVEEWHDDDAGPEAVERYAAAVSALRRVLALKAQLGEPAAEATIHLTDDPVLGSYQVAAVAPLGPMDQHALLAVEGPDERLTRVHALLEEEEDYLRRRLAMG